MGQIFYKSLYTTLLIGTLLSVSSAFADPNECAQNGCSMRDCTAAYQNGYTCKAWKCFKRCMSSKGFYGSCYDDMSKMEQCTEANNACESQCKYR